MNKMLVGVFEREAAAFEGLSALKDLHRDGDITLYSSAVIAKDKNGKIEVKQAADSGPVGTAIGLLTGSLIGIIGGPAGKVAILADVEESWTTPLDTRLHALGGIVFRRLRGEIVEDQLARESAALEADLKALEEDLKQAAAENRAAIQRDIERVKTQLKATQDQAKERLDQAKAETEGRVKALQDQAKALTGRAKARIEKRIADAKADFEMRSRKLNQAWTLTKEALAA